MVTSDPAELKVRIYDKVTLIGDEISIKEVKDRDKLIKISVYNEGQGKIGNDAELLLKGGE